MTKIKIAVIGVGYLGRFHAQKYAQLKDTHLIAVCDIIEQTAIKVANELGCDAVIDYRTIVDKVDAVSIASTTKSHYEIVKFFLQQGKHVLVEKPICTTLSEAQELVDLAKQHDCIFQVGHIERYNRVILALREVLDNPRYIESVRATPFNLRTIDVNVAFDLMIHDIDIIRSLVPSNIKNIAANGVSVLSSYIDIANARIEFDNDCVANVTASRVNAKVIRKMRLFQRNGHLALDLSQKRLSHYSVGEKEIHPGIPELINKEQAFEQNDPLKEQIIDFIHCIKQNKQPMVSGEEGMKALEIAINITQIMRQRKDWRQSKLSQLEMETV